MLDLSVFQKQTFEVKLMDGQVIHLLKPSQRMLIEMMSYEAEFKNTKREKDLDKIFDTFNSMILNILNNNDDEKVFDKEYVNKYFDFEVGTALMNGYMNFVNEINSNPNL